MADSDCNTVLAPIPSNPRFVDLTGKTFDRWTVLGYAGKKGEQHSWRCRCSCGTEKVVYGHNLPNGKSRSCGCLQREVIRSASTVHGWCAGNQRTSEHNSYILARDRCNNKNNHAYSRYGGRGIEFRFKSFLDFIECIGKKPGPNYSLDRIDANGHYEHGNVRWATDNEQANNTRKTIKATINGVTKSLSDWLTHGSSEYHWARKQVLRNGMHPDLAVTLALARRPRPLL